MSQGKFYLLLAVSAEEVQPFHSFEDKLAMAPLDNFGIEEIWITNFEDFTTTSLNTFSEVFNFSKLQKHT